MRGGDPAQSAIVAEMLKYRFASSASSTRRKPVEMRPGLWRPVLRCRGLSQNAPDALGRETELHQCYPRVEYLGLARDELTLELEAADPFEQHGPTRTFRQA